MQRWFRYVCTGGAALALVATVAVLRAGPDGLLGRVRRRLLREPSVSWARATPESVGLDAAALERLWEFLRMRRTDAFVVVRRGQLVFERYGEKSTANTTHYTAASAKGLLAMSALLTCMQDGRIQLDDPLAKFAPTLGPEPERAHIRIADLAFHTSGLDDVDFAQAEKGEVAGWQKEYYEHPERRFEYALRTVPMLFEPGTRARYSGIGYYALAYAVTKSLQGSADPDISQLLRDRVMRPLGIADSAWSLSYGESYQQDGLKLYAFGSGAKITARAAARLVDWMLHRGSWNGSSTVDGRLVDRVLGRDDAKPLLSTDHGWHLNRVGEAPSLPPDAFFAFGAGDKVALGIPSLELVVVRQGESLEPSATSSDEAIDRNLFRPVMELVRSSPSADLPAGSH